MDQTTRRINLKTLRSLNAWLPTALASQCCILYVPVHAACTMTSWLMAAHWRSDELHTVERMGDGSNDPPCTMKLLLQLERLASDRPLPACHPASALQWRTLCMLHLSCSHLFCAWLGLVPAAQLANSWPPYVCPSRRLRHIRAHSC